MPIIVYVHIHLRMGYFKARGVKKDSIPDMTETELTNIWASTNKHRELRACSEFRACAQRFLVSIFIAVMLGCSQT